MLVESRSEAGPGTPPEPMTTGAALGEGDGVAVVHRQERSDHLIVSSSPDLPLTLNAKRRRERAAAGPPYLYEQFAVLQSE